MLDCELKSHHRVKKIFSAGNVDPKLKILKYDISNKFFIRTNFTKNVNQRQNF